MLTYFNGAKGSKLRNTTFYVSFCFQVVKGRFTAKVLGFFSNSISLKIQRIDMKISRHQICPDYKPLQIYPSPRI